jgi:hypothetical protein
MNLEENLVPKKSCVLESGVPEERCVPEGAFVPEESY